MITYADKEFYLNLLDTNAISEIVKNNRNERTVYFKRILENRTIPCISIWSILELRKSDYLYPKFVELFSAFPVNILKPYTDIIKEEVHNYPKNTSIDPILFTCNPLSKKRERLSEVLEDLFNNHQIIDSENNWEIKRKQDVLDSILSLKGNFEPKNKNFNANDAKTFLKVGIPQYIKAQFSGSHQKLNISEELINIDLFPSVKMLFYTVFYRFYAEKRKPELQDIPDLMINFIAPYIDSIVVEKFQAEIYKKIKKKDNFIESFEVYTLKDLVQVENKEKSEWVGKYWFLGNVPDKLKNRKTEFEMIIKKHEDSKIFGEIFDNLETGGTAGVGSVSGTIKGNKIEFVKRMPLKTSVLPNGKRIEEEKEHRPIYYKGTIDQKTGIMHGTWRFKMGIGFVKGQLAFYPGTKGGWEMKTKHNKK